MKTPMQEMLEWVRVTLPMDLDTARLIEEKVISMLEKEKDVIKSAYNQGYRDSEVESGVFLLRDDISKYSDAGIYYHETFNTKER